MLLKCAQPSSLFDGKIGRKIPTLPESGDLLKHYTWKKAITPNPFVVMKFVKPLVELTDITLYFYKQAGLKINLPSLVRLCISTSARAKCSQIQTSSRSQFTDGVVAWPALLKPAKSVTF